VLTCLPQFALFFFVPISPHSCLILLINQHVPILFQQEVCTVNSHSIICFKPISPFHYFLYITNTLFSSFIISTNCLFSVIKCDKPNSSLSLTYFIPVSLIVYSVCTLVFKEPYFTLYSTCYNL
jgi:hypothetical protein